MKVYFILAYEADSRTICFAEYHATPNGVPETSDEVIRHALRWHPDLGTKKHPNVRFYVQEILDTESPGAKVPQPQDEVADNETPSTVEQSIVQGTDAGTIKVRPKMQAQKKNRK